MFQKDREQLNKNNDTVYKYNIETLQNVQMWIKTNITTTLYFKTQSQAFKW